MFHHLSPFFYQHIIFLHVYSIHFSNRSIAHVLSWYQFNIGLHYSDICNNSRGIIYHLMSCWPLFNNKAKRWQRMHQPIVSCVRWTSKPTMCVFVLSLPLLAFYLCTFSLVNIRYIYCNFCQKSILVSNCLTKVNLFIGNTATHSHWEGKIDTSLSEKCEFFN